MFGCLYEWKCHLDMPYFYADDTFKNGVSKILTCFIYISFTLFLVIAHFTFILIQLMFRSLQYHDSKKTDNSKLDIFFFFLIALLAFGANGLREETSRALERKRGLSH